MLQGLNSNRKSILFPKIKVGVLRGGSSAERRISLRSGRAVYRALKRSGIAVVNIDPANREQFHKRIHEVDILFVALHGAGGEDGSLQKVLEKKGILYAGSCSRGCRKSFNKLISKRYFEKLGIPTPSYTVIQRSDWQRKAAAFPTPYFVKPLDGGSSQGVFLVEDFEKSAEKIKRSILRYKKLLIEKKISGREITAGILGHKKLPIVEIKPTRAFYDYKAKYTAGQTLYEVPAALSPQIASKVQKIAWRVHQGLGLKDFSRVDLMLDAQNRPYVLEVNTIPGLTELSLLPKAARAAGISFEKLCICVLESAFQRAFKNKKKV